MMEPSSAQESGATSEHDPRSAGAETTTSRIGPTVNIKGVVTAEEDLLILGKVEGVIAHDQILTIHAQGAVKADIKAREIFIEGTVDGNVYATGRVRIEDCGSVNGDVLAPRIAVAEGSSLKGFIEMESDAAVIEDRFRERTGCGSVTHSTPGDPTTDSAVALVSEAASTISSGESDAAQAAEQRQSDAETDTQARDIENH